MATVAMCVRGRKTQQNGGPEAVRLKVPYRGWRFHRSYTRGQECSYRHRAYHPEPFGGYQSDHASPAAGYRA